MSTTIPIPEKPPTKTNESPEGPSTASLQRMLSEWQKGTLWHKSAPMELRGAELRGNGKQGNGSPLGQATAWDQWTEHLSQRKAPVNLRRLCQGKTAPLDWGISTTGETAGVAQWREKLDRAIQCADDHLTGDIESMVATLRDELRVDRGSDAFSVGSALRAVIVAYRLPQLAAQLDVAEWWRLAVVLLELAEAHQAVTDDDPSADDTLVAVLLCGELPLVLSVQLAELKPFRALRSAARQCLGDGLLAATDGEGVIDSYLLPVLPTLFASWTRCRAIGERLKKNCWAGKAESQFEWLVTQTMKLMRPSGQSMLAGEEFLHWPAGALDTALDLAGNEGDQHAASAHLAKVLADSDSQFDDDSLPDPSTDSEWASLAVLANGWDAKACRALVDYSQQELRIEIEAEGRTLFSGCLTTETHFCGKLLKPVGDWEQQCWSSDEDCDFLDLAIDLTGGARLERQILLGKKDGFLLLHDILLSSDQQLGEGKSGEKSGEWRHRIGLPLHGGTVFAPEQETRDGRLVDARGTTRAALLPLALAEWRVETRFGELASSGSELQLDQQTTGIRMSSPLWIDLQPKRASKKRTWRQLTVAESLEPVAADVAAGYRVQSGDTQWLLYRSLAAPGNRTLLGQNSSAEMLIGRFLRTGELEDLLEVEAV